MANEITTSVAVTVNNGELVRQFSKNVRADQATALADHDDQIVGTTHEALDLGDITLGIVAIYNRDDTNYVEIGIDQTGTFVPVVKVPAGQIRLIEPASGVTLYVRANTANVTIERMLVNA